MSDSPDTFDWATDDSVVVQAQPSLAVYPNRFEQVVIRCEGVPFVDDTFVHISRGNVLTVVRSILLAADMSDVKLQRECASENDGDSAAAQESRDSATEAPQLRLIAAK